MKREELPELHYITPIENVPSILALGILSNRRARHLKPKSIARQEVQDLRAKVRIPGGRALHEYANLYICARNPMMFVRAALHETTCVLRVSTDVLDLPNVVITTRMRPATIAALGLRRRALQVSIARWCSRRTGGIPAIQRRIIGTAR
jgi:ssDNA thymidine ADP-ribosyltransferase, DarT